MNHKLLGSLLALGCCTALLGAEPKVSKNLFYTAEKQERQSLDVYAPPQGELHPMVLWIHGGAWKAGDKAHVQHKPQAFVDRGYVFAATNYRFVPHVTIAEMAGDIAAAVKYLREHAAEFGGDPDAIFIAGHSAGAHLAALVCTDSRYLAAAGLSLLDIKGCIPVDTAMYDVPRQLKDAGPIRGKLYDGVFGEQAEQQQKYSPITHVGPLRYIPPFLVLHVANRADSTSQSEAFAKALRAASVPVDQLAAEGKDHGSINRDLGVEKEPITTAVFEFLAKQKRPRSAVAFEKRLHKKLTPPLADEQLGKADGNIGSGLLIYEYRLADGAYYRLGFGSGPIMYAHKQLPEGKYQQLPLK